MVNTDWAKGIIKKYTAELLENTKMHYIKQKELEEINWRATRTDDETPASWWPNGLFDVPENWDGPDIDFEDHYNCADTREKWLKLKKTESWAEGVDCEFGHDKHGNPFIRMQGAFTTSMWYPLHEAAVKWGEAREKAKTDWNWAVASAE